MRDAIRLSYWRDKRVKNLNRLLEDYKPLILSVYKRSHPLLSNREDKEDLLSQINSIFIKLVYEYDPRRGVDFPYYIKKMLQLRTYHYVTKQLQTKNREVITESFTNDEIHTVLDGLEEIDELINLESWDDSDFTLGKKQRKLFEGIVAEKKSLRELAAEEGVDVSILHTRMHFLLKKLKSHAAEQRRLEEI